MRERGGEIELVGRVRGSTIVPVSGAIGVCRPVACSAFSKSHSAEGKKSYGLSVEEGWDDEVV